MKTLENEKIRIEFDESNALFSVIVKETGDVWKGIKPGDYQSKAEDVSVTSFPYYEELKANLNGFSVPLELRLIVPKGSQVLKAWLRAKGDLPMKSDIAYPYQFAISPERGWLVIPEREGILLPAKPMSDLPIENMRYSLFGWRPSPFLSMPWIGVTDLKRGYVGIIETPYDAEINLEKASYEGSPLICSQVYWLPSKGRLTYTRKVLYYFSSEGGYVSLARYYNKYAKSRGFYVSLREKAEENPEVHKLIGAANIWVWDDARNIEVIKELRRSGIEKAIISFPGVSPQDPPPRLVDEINGLGFLAGRYDNYNIARPEEYEENAIRREDGSLFKHPHGRERVFRCGKPGFELARRLIPEDLKDRRFLARLIDTIASQELRECYDPGHPMSRGENAEYRAKLLAFAVSQGIVVGSEDVMDWAVPYLHYSEGPMSLERFMDRGMRRVRVPEGLDFKLVPMVPGPIYGKYGLGEYYRVPLYELVYHGAIVTTWHWRTSNHRVSGMWDRADLFNILYGNMPLWWLSRQLWRDNRDRFVKCYRDVCGWHERIGFDEMVDHRWLTEDRAVQETRFSSGLGVIVNFGDEPYVTAEGKTVKPRNYLITSPRVAG